jgi:hypothetical protein
VFFLLNMSFEKAVDTPIKCRSNLLKNSQKHPVPHRIAVRRLTEKFHETGSVLDAERSGRPSKFNNKKLMDISNSAVESIKIIAQVGMRERYRSCDTAHKVVQ